MSSISTVILRRAQDDSYILKVNALSLRRAKCDTSNYNFLTNYFKCCIKKINALILILSFVIFIPLSCSDRNGFSEKISGKWYMVKVLELSEDVTENHNPNNNRWIGFSAEPDIADAGSFESGTGEDRENTGNWYYNAKENELFLDSDAGEDDDSYWEVSFKTDSMYWKGRKFEFNKRFEIFYKKAD